MMEPKTNRVDVAWGRFLAKFRQGPDAECWDWLAGRFGNGYGLFSCGTCRDDKHLERAHRLSYEYFVGPIPDGQLVCHTCDNRACVNPAHLFLGSHKDNMADMRLKGRSAHPTGEKHPAAKLNAAQINEIKSRYAGGGVTQKALGDEYGVGHVQICRILSGARWGTTQ